MRPLAITLMLLLALEVLASDYVFLADHTPLSHFDEQDKALLLEAASEVLNAKGPAKKQWKNPETGHSGELQTLNSFNSEDGRFCKSVRIRNRAGALENRSLYPVCRGSDGVWKIDSGAKPRQKDK